MPQKYALLSKLSEQTTKDLHYHLSHYLPEPLELAERNRQIIQERFTELAKQNQQNLTSTFEDKMQGTVGPEHRVEWLEPLGRGRSDVGLPPREEAAQVLGVPGLLDEQVDLAGHTERGTLLQALQLLLQSQ